MSQPIVTPKDFVIHNLPLNGNGPPTFPPAPASSASPLPRRRAGAGRARAALALVAALALSALPAGSASARRSARPHAVAASRPQIGISDNSPGVFGDPRFRWLGMRLARLVMPYNIMRRKTELAIDTTWLQQAQLHGTRPLVVFDKDPKHPGHLPTLAEYSKAIQRFMTAFPWVTDYSAWNEENHYLQPTASNPQRAAQYFNLLSRLCRRCTVTAADVLDIPNMAEWTRKFLRFAHHPRFWGLHNYTDLSAGEHTRTSQFLSIVPGQVWFTETGGVVWRFEHSNHRYVVHNESYAAEVAGHLLGLAHVSSRVTRIYYYQWRVPQTLSWARRHGKLTWDSGILRPDCSPRPAFGVIARAMGRAPSRLPRARRDVFANCVAP